MKNPVVDISKMPISDVVFFLHDQLEQYNVMTFEFVSTDVDVDFVDFLSYLKGWYSAYIIQLSDINYLKVTFVTKVNPSSFVKRLYLLSKINKKGGILL